MDVHRLVDLQVLNEAAYFHELLGKLKAVKKRDRVAIMTMSFDPAEQYIPEVMQELTAAAKRGAHIWLTVDAFSFMINRYLDLPTGPAYYRRDIHRWKRPYYREKAELLAALESAGGHYGVINAPKTKSIVPYGGRSHIKTVAINNELYVGGCDLSHTGEIDLMVRVKDASAAEYVYEIVKSAVQKGDTQAALEHRDCELALDGYTSLLIDSGKRSQSLIFDQALELIDAADEWIVMTCQYFPNSITARHLAAARSRGVQVRLYYNHPSHHSHIQVLAHQLVILQERTKHHKELFMLKNTKKQRRIHAKLIATEQGAIIGSHNYVNAGVKLGTAEIAILRRKPAFAKQAVGVIEPSLLGLASASADEA